MSKKNIYLPRLKMCKPKETFKVPCTEVIIAEDEHRVAIVSVLTVNDEWILLPARLYKVFGREIAVGAIDGVNAGEAQAYMYDTKTGRAIFVETVNGRKGDLHTEIFRATQQMLEKLESDCLASLLYIDGINFFLQVDLQAQELANQPIQLSRPAFKVKRYKTTEEMMDSYIKNYGKDWIKKNVKK
ncbi:hypothetical protein ABVC51_04735 [Lactobacillus iners]|uniref:hypothetical protein n=1 Tax=Lactobacillus iners TaxID=147802 RepID=UPI001F098028|nr:hypothetical protein [Lactobacillus iners]